MDLYYIGDVHCSDIIDTGLCAVLGSRYWNHRLSSRKFSWPTKICQRRKRGRYPVLAYRRDQRDAEVVARGNIQLPGNNNK